MLFEEGEKDLEVAADSNESLTHFAFLLMSGSIQDQVMKRVKEIDPESYKSIVDTMDLLKKQQNKSGRMAHIFGDQIFNENN